MTEDFYKSPQIGVNIMTIRQYSSYFSCIYDERQPVGDIGNGTHYSIMRAVEWLDVCLAPCKSPLVHDFAVIWNNHHNEQVIPFIEEIYMAGLLSPARFIGEQEGTLTFVVTDEFWFQKTDQELDYYSFEIANLCRTISDGGWNSIVCSFEQAPLAPPDPSYPDAIVSDDEYCVATYLQNISNLWKLGTRPFIPISKEASATLRGLS